MILHKRSLLAVLMSAAIQVCVFGFANAQPAFEGRSKPVTLSDAATLKAQYAALLQGMTFTSKGIVYAMLPDLRAASTPTQPPEGLAVIERKGNYLIYRATQPEIQSSKIVPVQSAAFTVRTHAVARNTQTGNVGIVLGTIVVKLTDFTQSQAVADSTGVSLLAQYPQLGVAFYKASPGQDVVDAAAALTADARVISAEPEILEHPRVPK